MIISDLIVMALIYAAFIRDDIIYINKIVLIFLIIFVIIFPFLSFLRTEKK